MSTSFPFLPLQLLDSYVMSSREVELNSAACRLLLSMAPGLDTEVVFQEKVRRTSHWGQQGSQVRSTYDVVLCLLSAGRKDWWRSSLIGRTGGSCRWLPMPQRCWPVPSASRRWRPSTCKMPLAWWGPQHPPHPSTLSLLFFSDFILLFLFNIIFVLFLFNFSYFIFI